MSGQQGKLSVRQRPVSRAHLYIVVLDGSEPVRWQPCGGKSFSLLRSRMESFYAGPTNEQLYSYPGAKTNYIIRSLKDIKHEDTPSIVGALIDGRNFSTEKDCPRVTVREIQLMDLAAILRRRRDALYKKYGFRLWITTGEQQVIDVFLLKRLKNALSELLLQYSEIKDEQIDSEGALIHVAKTFTLSAAQIHSLDSSFLSPSSA